MGGLTGRVAQPASNSRMTNSGSSETRAIFIGHDVGVCRQRRILPAPRALESGKLPAMGTGRTLLRQKRRHLSRPWTTSAAKSSAAAFTSAATPSSPSGLPDELPATADEVIDCRGKVLLPGLVNTHHHFFQTLTRARARGAGRRPLRVAARALSAMGAAHAGNAQRVGDRRDGGADALRLHDRQRPPVPVSQRRPARRHDRRGARDRPALPRLPRRDERRRIAGRPAARRAGRSARTRSCATRAA